jgi:hypothetical protein
MSNLDGLDAITINSELARLARARGWDPRRLLHAQRVELLELIEKFVRPSPEPKVVTMPDMRQGIMGGTAR